MNWQAVGAIGSSISAVVVIVGACVALTQSRVAFAARNMSAVLGLAHQLEIGSLRATRRLLWLRHEDIVAACKVDAWADIVDTILLDASGQKIGLSQVRDDLATLEYASLLALHGMVPTDVSTTYFLPVVVSAWPDIEPLASVQRKAIGGFSADGDQEVTIYLQHTEALYELASSGQFASAAKRRERLERLRLNSIDANSDGYRGGW